ncbi:MAG: hypothetical protein IKY92_02510 [Akkermansia sp.]|nr:hypothetical protein [Akkermansia sp.]
MAEITGNAVIDGARLLDEVEGEGIAETWLNLCLSQGGWVVAMPWVFIMAYPRPEDERELYVAYAYGDLSGLAWAARMTFASGSFDRLSFRRGFGSGQEEEERRVYDYAEFMNRMERLARRVK